MIAPYYDHKGITIYHGDARDVLPCVPADVLITDPPYGIKYASGYASDVREGGSYVNTCGSILGDRDTAARDEILSIWGDTRPALVFGSLRASFPKNWKQALIWDKGDAAGMGDLSIPWKPNFDLIFVLGKWGGGGRRTSGVLRANNISRLSMGRDHPHMKPVHLMQALIQKTAGAVVDPFMGAGTTLRAAKDLGRRAIGIELEEKYCEAAAQRLAQEVLL